MFLPFEVLPLDFQVCLFDAPTTGYSAKLELLQRLLVKIPRPASRMPSGCRPFFSLSRSHSDALPSTYDRHAFPRLMNRGALRLIKRSMPCNLVCLNPHSFGFDLRITSFGSRPWRTGHSLCCLIC